LFTPYSFFAFGEIATLRGARKDGMGGLLTKGSSLLFPYSEPVKPFARLTTKDEMGQFAPLIPDPSPLREKAKRGGVCAVVPE
jgi:hypothetical protein